MLTISELAAIIAIWVLFLAGVFFVGRASWLSRRQQCEERKIKGAY